MVRSGSTRRPSVAAASAAAFTASPGDYRLLEEVGYGANAVVYRAVFLPANRIVAVKCLDLNWVNSNLLALGEKAYAAFALMRRYRASLALLLAKINQLRDRSMQ